VKGSPAAQILSLFEAASHELASAHGGVRCRIAIRSTSGHLPPLRPGSSQPTAPLVLAAVAATAADDDDIDLLTAWTMMMMARKPRGGKACRLKYHAVKSVPHYCRAKRLCFENPIVVTATGGAAANDRHIREAVRRNHRPLLNRVSLGAAAADWVARLRISFCTIRFIIKSTIDHNNNVEEDNGCVHRKCPEQSCDA